jgi:peptidoglycan/LPS O-acetylase OafA/YrhL
MTNERSAGNDWFPSLNGLRAISVGLVILHHLGKNTDAFEALTRHRWIMPLVRMLQDGHLGVNAFFIISGFLITTLLLKEEERTNTISVKKFYLRRLLRIFPAYYFLLLVYVVLNILGVIQISGMSFLTAFTYTKYFNWNLDWFTAHAWSLSIEEQFYLCWPLIFLRGPQFRKLASWSLFLGVPVIRTVLHFYPVSWMGELTLFWRIDAIATGCLLALYKDRILAVMRPYWTPICWTSLIVLFVLRYIPPLADRIHLGFIFIPLGRTTYGTIGNCLIAAIIMYSVFGPRGYWFKCLNLKPVNYIGTISYSIYLWQQIFISEANWWVAKFPQNIGFVFLAALFSYYVIERPFLRLKSKV